MTSLPLLEGTLDDDRVRYRGVPVAQLRGVWPLLQYGLSVVRDTNKEPWINEDVYASLLHGRSVLYLFEDAATDELLGFAVFESIFFPYEFRPRLNMWIGWAREKGLGYLGYELARRIARVAGIDSVVFCTPQENGWVKRHRKLFTWYEVQ